MVWREAIVDIGVETVWGGGGVEKLSRDRVSESIRLREEKAYHITAEFRKMPQATCHRAHATGRHNVFRIV
jgi:hypothetical protein